MPVKTITAEVDGKVRKFKMDIPDDASQQEIMSAIEGWSKSQQTDTKKVDKPAKPGSLEDLSRDAAKYPMMGGPVLPTGAMLPTAVGMGVETLGRKAGLPEWANLAAGGAAGLLAGNPKAIVRGISQIPMVPEGAAELAGVFRPEVGFALKSANKIRKMLGLVPKVAEDVPKTTPYPAGKGTGTKYGGPAEPKYGAPGKNIPRRGFKPPAAAEEETAVPKAKPVKAAEKKPYRRPVKDTEFNRKLSKIARERGIPEPTPDMPPSKFE